MSAVTFDIIARDSRSQARAGVLKTPSGAIHTPAFIAVGTVGSVKGITPELLARIGIQLIIANTYHIYLRPGERIIAGAGGLHSFVNWQGPLMTDSGGFQVFSLGPAFGGKIKKIDHEDLVGAMGYRSPTIFNPSTLSQHGQLAIIDEEGVTFTSHLDGSLHRFTPERSIEIQHALGADIIVAFDECTTAAEDYTYQRAAMERTHRWAERSLATHRRNIAAAQRQALFGVVQGGPFEALRRESARTLGAMPFDGFGVGGSLKKESIAPVTEWIIDELPDNKPRHLMGVGEPDDIVAGIRNGIDLFDCVQPTRIARTGVVYDTVTGEKLNLLNSRFRDDYSCLDQTGENPLLYGYTKAYVSHLFRAKEMLGPILASINNLWYINTLIGRIRTQILNEGV